MDRRLAVLSLLAPLFAWLIPSRPAKAAESKHGDWDVRVAVPAKKTAIYKDGRIVTENGSMLFGLKHDDRTEHSWLCQRAEFPGPLKWDAAAMSLITIEIDQSYRDTVERAIGFAPSAYFGDSLMVSPLFA